MAIVCRKCNYEISEGQIKIHVGGAICSFIYQATEFVNNLYSSYNAYLNFQKKSVKDTPEILHEKNLSALANQQKILCERCFEYNGWMRIADEATDEE